MSVRNLTARCGFFMWALLLAWSGEVWSAARFAVATGNWNVSSTWSATSGGAAGASVPVAGDDVTIGETATARTVTIPAGYAAAASSVVLATAAGVNGAKALTLAANTSSLTVSGNLTVNKPGNNNTNALNVNAGTVTVNGTLTLGGTTNAAVRIAAIVITTGTLTIGTDLVFVTGNAASNVINLSSSTGTINLAGAFTATVGTISNPGTGIFNYNGANAQTVRIVSSIVYPNLHLNNTNATGATLSAAISAANVTGNVRVQSGILNNGGFAIVGGAADTFEVAAGARFNLTGTSTMATTFGTRTFAATSTVSYQGGNQAVASGLSYGNLILSGGSNKTPAAGTITVAGDFTVGGGTTYAGNTNNPAVNLAGDFSNSGTFTSGTGVFTFNGAAGTAQTITGVTTFTSMTVNNSAGLNLANNVTVTTAAAGTLTLTSGAVSTGANTLITARRCNAPSVARTSGYVVGNLRKAIPANASTCTFEIGSGANYTPVVAVFVAGTGAGNITASTTGTEHASLGASGIDSTKSVNRYWTLTNGGVTLPAAGFSATFNYINGSPLDFDVIGTPASFIVERWDGANWFPTTLNAGCTANPGTNLCKQINGLTATAFGDFAIGEARAGFNPNPGAFNVFESTTPAGSVLGRLYTERLGAGAFAVSIVAVLNNAINPAPSTAALTVAIIDASPTGGTLTAASNCRTTWTTVIQTQTVPAAVAWASGRINVNITAPVQAVRNARIRVTQGANVGCSTDNFAIRPQAFTVTSTDATQTNTSGPPAIKTGANFNLTAASGVGYDGAPSLDNTQVVGTPTAGAIGGSFSAAPVVTGTATGAGFFYSEAGNFGLNANAVFDSSFTSVDQPNDCTADFSNTPVGGRYGCSFGSTAIAQTLGVSGFGRFIPDNFTVSLNTPQFATGCGTFTYVGTTVSYVTVPVLTVTARNGTNNGLTNATTTNYGGAYMKMTNASLTPITQGGRYSRFDALGGGTTPALDPTGLPAIAGDPAIGTFAAGVGTLTFGSGTGLAFARSTTTPSAPFNADIALALNVIDADGVAYAANPASFGAAAAGNGIGFNSGKTMRFGRLRVLNSSGSQLIAMPITMQAQYWNGSGFVLNTDDNCTAIVPGNVALGNYQKNLNSGETVVSGGGTFSAGAATLRLSAPGAANNGSVDVSVNLTGAPAGASCTAGMPASTGSNLTHLQGLWCTPPGTYARDPTARATFGLYRDTDQRVYQRENY